MGRQVSTHVDLLSDEVEVGLNLVGVGLREGRDL